MAETSRNYLGKGWKWPIQIDARTGGVATVEGVECVRQSILRIIRTVIGSRIMDRRFGSPAEDAVFEPATQEAATRLANDLRAAILTQERRVATLIVEGTIPAPNRINIGVTYSIARGSVVDSFVYPFYLQQTGG
jgi:hypothetical protein